MSGIIFIEIIGYRFGHKNSTATYTHSRTGATIGAGVDLFAGLNDVNTSDNRQDTTSVAFEKTGGF
ncbi:MAG: hypothetical protein KDJ32_09825, partial [Alphaproteobacteria bacterium]|nr:hypothetical protein [Alphaproteobacteria bacterium]